MHRLKHGLHFDEHEFFYEYLLISPSYQLAHKFNSGKVKVYGVTTRARVPALPNIPTLDEQGMKGFSVGVWHGIYAPKKTPKPVIDMLSTELKKVVADPAMKERFINIGFDPTPTSSEEMVAVMHKTADDWAPLIKRLNIKLD